MENQTEFQLLQACGQHTPKWTFKGLNVNAKCVDVYDGDTATFAFIPPGYSIPYKFSCRLAGYNSAEMRTTNPDIKEKAMRSANYLRRRILDKIVRMKIVKMKDKWGRLLVDIYLDGIYINGEMIMLGYGKPYDGTGPKPY